MNLLFHKLSIGRRLPAFRWPGYEKNIRSCDTITSFSGTAISFAIRAPAGKCVTICSSSSFSASRRECLMPKLLRSSSVIGICWTSATICIKMHSTVYGEKLLNCSWPQTRFWKHQYIYILDCERSFSTDRRSLWQNSDGEACVSACLAKTSFRAQNYYSIREMALFGVGDENRSSFFCVADSLSVQCQQIDFCREAPFNIFQQQRPIYLYGGGQQFRKQVLAGGGRGGGFLSLLLCRSSACTSIGWRRACWASFLSCKRGLSHI